MKRLLAMLMCTWLLSGALSAAPRDNLQFRLMALDRFMTYTMGPTGIPVKIPVPMAYQAEPADPAQRTTWWLHENDLAQMRRGEPLSERHGHMAGQLAADVQYDRSLAQFIGLEDRAGAASLRAELGDVQMERLEHARYPAVLLSGKDKATRRWIYQLYLALDIGSSVATVTLHPQGNDRLTGETLWRALRKSLIDSGHAPR